MKKTTIIISLITLFCLFLTACEDASRESSQDQKTEYRETVASQEKAIKNIPQAKLSKQPLSINWSSKGKRTPEQIKLQDPEDTSVYVDGEFVKATDMPLDKFINENGRITLRAGKGFFADWSVEVDVDNLKTNTMVVLNDTNTKVKISTKKPKHNLPSSTNLNGVKGMLKTGRISSLGMPIQMHLEVKEAGELPYTIDGKGFATIGDIKIKNNRLDKYYDSFKTIRIIAKYFVKDIKRVTPFVSRHVMYSSDKNVGVEALQVFSYKDENKKDKLVRIQLLKKTEGWEPVKILEPWKLLYSRKESRKRHSDELNVITSKKIESFLKKEKVDNHLDTSVSCRQSKDKTKGLCTAKITVLQNNEKNCLTKAYSLIKQKDWKIVKEVATNLKLEYKTGKLVEKKKKKKSFSEKIISDVAGSMFGKCSMF